MFSARDKDAPRPGDETLPVGSKGIGMWRTFTLMFPSFRMTSVTDLSLVAKICTWLDKGTSELASKIVPGHDYRYAKVSLNMAISWFRRRLWVAVVRDDV